MLHVYPTSRAIRKEVERLLQSEALLPKFITVSEFFSRVVLHKNRLHVDDERRAMLLLEASDFSAFAKLNIERNFFSFLHNSNYIFRFFEELQTELVSLESLDAYDTYGDYEEHIAILKELRSAYKLICEREGVDERIFYSDEYKLNFDYINSLKEVKLYIDGYVSNFELQVLLDVAKEIKLSIEFTASYYSKKMIERFLEHNIVMEKSGLYAIDLSLKEAKRLSGLSIEADIVCETLGERLLQVAFIKERVEAYIQEGIAPEDIVVVLPDESFANYIRLFDNFNNYNFAMGIDCSESLVYKKLEALILYSENSSHQNSERLSFADVAMLELFMQKRSEKFDATFFSDFIKANSKTVNKKEHRTKAIEELERFMYLQEVLKDLNHLAVLKLFTTRLAKVKLDDVGSGKITVMGLLESRQMAYKGVIVVDFNDDIVPKRSQKDMYINSQMRRHAKLPDSLDRENLQRHYYFQLFARAQKIAISCVESQQKVPSRFLSMLHISPQKRYSDEQYVQLLYRSNRHKPKEEKEIIERYDFKAQPLSATALKMYLLCPRSFYYRYIEKLAEHEIAQELPKESVIGRYLHEALQKVYAKKSSYTNINTLRSDLFKTLKEVAGSSILDEFMLRQWLEKLEPFLTSEIARFEQGIKVYKTEERLHVELEGITLFGIVDRIDTHSGILEVIDYKSGSYKLDTARSYETSSDFQLEFYYLLASTLGEVEACYYYDLNSAKLEQEVMLEPKLERLKEILYYLSTHNEYNFAKCESHSPCQYCSYKILCNRE